MYKQKIEKLQRLPPIEDTSAALYKSFIPLKISPWIIKSVVDSALETLLGQRACNLYEDVARRFTLNIFY